jgi:serine/threonine protein kinase
MEYCNGGNLVDLLPISPFTEPMIAYITREVLKALDYLHQRNRMHRGMSID